MRGLRRNATRTLAAAVLLLCAVAAVAPSHAQSMTDVAVTDLSLEGPAPEWRGGTAQATRVHAEVTNLGTVAASYTIAYYWGQVDAGHYLNGDSSSSTDVSHGPLAPGATAVHGVDWTPGAGQRGNGTLYAVVTATGDSRPDNDARSADMPVPVHDVALQWLTGDLSIRADEVRVFELAVHNAGTGAEALLAQAAFDRAGSGLTASVAGATVAAGGTAVLPVAVTLPFQASGLPGPINLTVAVDDATHSLGAASPPLRLQPTAQPLPPGALNSTLASLGDPAPAKPGQLLHASFALSNRGSADDSWTFAAVAPRGWGQSTLAGRLLLHPGEQATVQVEASPPSEAVPGSQVAIGLQAFSDRGSAGSAEANASARVAGPLVRLEPLDLPEAFYQGDVLGFTLRLRNIGSAASPPGMLNVTTSPRLPGLPGDLPVPALDPGVRAERNVTLLPARLGGVPRPAAFAFADLNRNGTWDAGEPVYVSVRPDRPSVGFDHPDGNGTVAPGDVRLHVASAPAGSVVPAGTVGSTGEVGRGPLVRAPLACVDYGQDGRCGPGDTLVLDLADNGTYSPGDLLLQPAGNRSAGDLVQPADDWTGLPLLPIPVGPGHVALAFADRTGDGRYGAPDGVVLDLHGDGVASEGDLRLTPLAAVGKALKPFGSAIAPGDPDDGTFLAPLQTEDLDGFLGPVAVHAEWRPLDPALALPAPADATLFVRTANLTVLQPAAATAGPGVTVDYLVPPQAFQVRNGGNAAERVHLAASGHLGNVTLLGPDEIVLGPGEQAVVPVRQQLPLHSPTGLTLVRLRAELADRPATFAQAELPVRLADLQAPTLQIVGLPAVWDPSHPLTVRLAADDDVGVENATITVQAGDGVHAVAADDSRDGSGQWTASFQLPVGPAIVTARAVDGAGHSATAGPVTLEVRAVPPPRILYFLPDGLLPVAPGDEVRAQAEDPVGLESATLAVDGGSPQPLALDGNGTISGTVPDLPTGAHHLVLTVTDRAGVSAVAGSDVHVEAAAVRTQGPSGHDSPSPGALLAAAAVVFAVLRRARGRQPDVKG